MLDISLSNSVRMFCITQNREETMCTLSASVENNLHMWIGEDKCILKGIVHLNMKLLSINLHNLYSSEERKKSYFEGLYAKIMVHCMDTKPVNSQNIFYRKKRVNK